MSSLSLPSPSCSTVVAVHHIHVTGRVAGLAALPLGEPRPQLAGRTVEMLVM